MIPERVREMQSGHPIQSHSVYQMISHSDRLNVIYDSKVHNLRKGSISQRLGINYSSVQSILGAYEKTGRTNKKQYLLLNYMKTHGLQTQEHTHFARRGRKKLNTNNSILFDAFCE